MRYFASNRKNVPVDQKDFELLSGKALDRLEALLDEVGLEVDRMSDGILELELSDGEKIVINRHTVAREIWVAARSGGFHFRHDEGSGCWRDTRADVPLGAKLHELTKHDGLGAFDVDTD